MSQKHLVFLVLLPTTLRGFIPRVHESICHLAEGLRLLDGQVFSYNKALKKRIPPGMRAGTILSLTSLSNLALTLTLT